MAKQHRSKSTYHKRRAFFRPSSARGDSITQDSGNQSKISITAYDGSKIHEEEIQDVAKLKECMKGWKTVWVRVEGLNEPKKIEAVGELFGLHQLALEDIFTNQNRAKIEQYGSTFFFQAPLMTEDNGFSARQLSLFFGKSFVVTFQDQEIKAITAVQDRIKKNVANIRGQGADYLAYIFLDLLVDSYYPLLDKFSDRMEDLEESVVEDATPQVMSEIHTTKRDLLMMRRAIWPLREGVNALLRDGSDELSAETRIHLRDCYDEVVRLIDFAETYRELGSDLMDVYLSSVSNKLNEIMKVLTILTTIFAPPTLIAGIYGMNFSHEISPYNMPEYTWYYGYPYALILMVCTSLGIVLLLWSKGWLKSANPKHLIENPMKQKDETNAPKETAGLIPAQSLTTQSEKEPHL